MIWIYLVAYLFGMSFLLTFILTPLFAQLARRLDVLDQPGPRKLHNVPVPLLGGLAIFASFAIIFWGHLFGALILRNLIWSGTPIAQHLPGELYNLLKEFYPSMDRVSILFAGAFFIVAVGLLDDLLNLSAEVRLLSEVIIALIVIMAGIKPELPFLPSPYLEIVSALWIVAITNSFNLLDGADGLVAGVAFIVALVFSASMLLTNQPMVAIFLAILSGSACGFLPSNFYPARIFMGSAGSMFLGYIMGASTLFGSFILFEHRPVFSLMLPVFILSIPMYDSASVVFIRLREGRHILRPDRCHLVYRLMVRGMSQRRAVLIIYLATFLICINSILLLISIPSTIYQIIFILSILVVTEVIAFRRK